MGGLQTNLSSMLRSYGNKSLDWQFKSNDSMLQKQHWTEMGGLMLQIQEKYKNNPSSLKH